MEIALAKTTDDDVITLTDFFSALGDTPYRFAVKLYDRNEKVRLLGSHRTFREAYTKFLDIANTFAAEPIIRKDRLIQTREDLDDLLDHVAFKNSVLDFNWKFHVKNATIASDSGYADETSPCWAVYASFSRPETHTGQMGDGYGRSEFIEPGFTETRAFFVLYTIFEMLIRHEFMEGIHLIDELGHFRITNPHSSVWSLAQIQPEEAGVEYTKFLSLQSAENLRGELQLTRVLEKVR